MSKREAANLLLLEAEVKDSLDLELILKEIGSSWACTSFPQPFTYSGKGLVHPGVMDHPDRNS